MFNIKKCPTKIVLLFDQNDDLAGHIKSFQENIIICSPVYGLTLSVPKLTFLGKIHVSIAVPKI